MRGKGGYEGKKSSGGKINWDREKYRGKKMVHWAESDPDYRLHELRVKEFFESKRRRKKDKA